MAKVTFLRGARQLLTLRGPSGPRRGTDLQNLGIIPDGALLVVDGRIAEVGSTRRIENLAAARDAEEIDARGCVVLPGLVDSDAQIITGTLRGMSPRALKLKALGAMEDAIHSGTTALGMASAEIKMLRAYAALREFPFGLVSTFAASGLAPALAGRTMAALRRGKLAEFVEIGCDQEAVLAQARQYGWGVKTRVGSTPDAIAEAVRIGATSVNGVVHASEREAMLLANSRTIATLSPGFALGQAGAGYPPARPLIDRGAAIAFASGGNLSNLLLAIAVACGALNITPAEAIFAATINSAYAIASERSIGSLEVGKSADLVILGVPDYRELPYHLGVNLVNLVMIRGAVLLKKSAVKWPVR